MAKKIRTSTVPRLHTEHVPSFTVQKRGIFIVGCLPVVFDYISMFCVAFSDFWNGSNFIFPLVTGRGTKHLHHTRLEMWVWSFPVYQEFTNVFTLKT